MLQITDNAELDINVRQFAIANLKNNLKKYWKQKKAEDPCFSEEDKTTVKDNILQALIRSSLIPKLAKMYCKVIYDILAYDFPKNWPNFVENAV